MTYINRANKENGIKKKEKGIRNKLIFLCTDEGSCKKGSVVQLILKVNSRNSVAL